MWNKNRIITLLVLFSGLSLGARSYAQTDKVEQHRQVVMRMIGHEVLLNSKDTTSRVLPVEKVKARYKIQFENEFSFQPQELGAIIDRLIKKHDLSHAYIVEVEDCVNREVVYSYEIANIDSLEVVPCLGRVQPRGCYTLYLTLNDNLRLKNVQQKISSKIKAPMEQENYSGVIWSVVAILAIVTLIIYLKRKGQGTPNSADLVLIGNTLYDKRGMILKYKSSKTELSSKEADLLLLLFESENKTLEREYLLKEIWNDEGDYVGRTLDVFVSKLRKKLESDASIRIINIRGVGYKLVIQ